MMVKELLEAYGGESRWQSRSRLFARVRFGGLAFAARWNRAGLRRREAVVFLQEQRVELHDFPRPGYRGVFSPDRVHLETTEGRLVAERREPRSQFGSFRRQLWWDDLDLLYFSGYALWNYLLFPWLLTLPGVEIPSTSSWQEGEESWQSVTVDFPPHLATHCPRQVFYFDEQYRLRRHDYDPQVFASWARAAHYCTAHVQVEGVWIPTRRRVVPRLPDGRSRPFPVLVWIELDAVVFE